MSGSWCGNLAAVAEACRDYEAEPAPQPMAPPVRSRWYGLPRPVIGVITLLATLIGRVNVPNNLS